MISTSKSKIENFEKRRKKSKFLHIEKNIFFHELNEINFKRLMGRLTNLASFGGIIYF
jgi:hypothetical protein